EDQAGGGQAAGAGGDEGEGAAHAVAEDVDAGGATAGGDLGGGAREEVERVVGDAAGGVLAARRAPVEEPHVKAAGDQAGHDAARGEEIEDVGPVDERAHQQDGRPAGGGGDGAIAEEAGGAVAPDDVVRRGADGRPGDGVAATHQAARVDQLEHRGAVG